MPCSSPFLAYKLSNGDVSLLERGDVISTLELPCGKCALCRLERARQWSIRIMHEAQLHAKNSFITLTYDDAHLPSDMSLDYSHFQKFMKRLRRSLPGVDIRYFVAGEYGTDFGRPHFHAAIFGYDFYYHQLPDVGKSPSGEMLRTSPELKLLWPFGFNSVGTLTKQSANYIARYIIDKQMGQDAINYDIINPQTGEVHKRPPEFVRMSLKPAIGRKWFEKYASDIINHDHAVVDGTPQKPPRYYDLLLKRIDPQRYENNKIKREMDALPRRSDNTRERLAVKEHVTLARLSQLKRHLT